VSVSLQKNIYQIHFIMVFFRNILLLFSVLFSSLTAISQIDTLKKDSVLVQKLNELMVIEKQIIVRDVFYLNEIDGTRILSGKKNEIINLGALDADLSTNNARQVFGKVPGVTVWESDGSGIQVGIATRGLSPNRSWEFNVRQNGYDISSEAYGYPEAYYTPPMEALERIEVIRGASSLQYGTQFGGLLNYVVKKNQTNKIFSFETQQTLGSYGLYNAFNAISGKYKKFSYYGYFHHRGADGWRENSEYKTNTGYINFNFELTKKLNLSIEYTRMNYQSQQPGGLTDSMYNADARQSLRARNWFSTPWNSTALNLDYAINANSKLNVKIFSTIAQRNSVGFTKAINIADTFNTAIGSFNPRQVDRDNYNNLGAEIRYLQSYSLFKNTHSLAAGVRVYQGKTNRNQLGIGTTGDDIDFSISALSSGKDYGRSLDFTTKNVAVFAENLFKIGKNLNVTPGVRYEMIQSNAKGYINTSATGNINENQADRNVILLGLGMEYKIKNTNVYANFSQSFRPVTFSELTPSATTDVIDPNLKDAKGYNLDFGYRGYVKAFLTFDIGGFFVNYDNRIGTISQNGAAFRTNIGTSESKGIESFVELDPLRIFRSTSKIGNFKLFVNYAFVDAKYTQWNNPAIANDASKSIENKRVENAPRQILRYGMNYKYKQFSATFQVNQVDAIYTDAANTELPNALATIGKLDGYTVMDASFTYLFQGKFNLKGGVNNLTNEKYSTRRAGGYPGPGILPANARTFYVGIGVKI
jgi:Fe(3+) dicitrate transport protein